MSRFPAFDYLRNPVPQRPRKWSKGKKGPKKGEAFSFFTTNGKVDDDITTLNTPAFESCALRGCNSTVAAKRQGSGGYCYAAQASLWTQPDALMAGSFRLWFLRRGLEKEGPEDMAAFLAPQILSPKVRWHSSGDVDSAKYWKMMCLVAAMRPDVGFYSYTKRGYGLGTWPNEPPLARAFEETPKPANLRMLFSTDSTASPGKVVDLLALQMPEGTPAWKGHPKRVTGTWQWQTAACAEVSPIGSKTMMPPPPTAPAGAYICPCTLDDWTKIAWAHWWLGWGKPGGNSWPRFIKKSKVFDRFPAALRRGTGYLSSADASTVRHVYAHETLRSIFEQDARSPHRLSIPLHNALCSDCSLGGERTLCLNDPRGVIFLEHGTVAKHTVATWFAGLARHVGERLATTLRGVSLHDDDVLERFRDIDHAPLWAQAKISAEDKAAMEADAAELSQSSAGGDA